MSEDNDWKISGWQEAGGAALFFNAVGQASRERERLAETQRSLAATLDTNIILSRQSDQRAARRSAQKALFQCWEALKQLDATATSTTEQISGLIVLLRMVDEDYLDFFELVEFSKLQKEIITIAKSSGLADVAFLLRGQKRIRSVSHREFDKLVQAKFHRSEISKGTALTKAAIDHLADCEPDFLLSHLDAQLSVAPKGKALETSDGVNLLVAFINLLERSDSTAAMQVAYNKLADPQWSHNDAIVAFIKANKLVEPDKLLELFQSGHPRAIRDAATLLFEEKLYWTAADAEPLREIVKCIGAGLPKPEAVETTSFIGKTTRTVLCLNCNGKTEEREAATLECCPRCHAISFLFFEEGGKGRLIERLTRRIEVLEDLEHSINGQA